MRFMERSHLRNTKDQTEAISSNLEAAAYHSKYLAKIIDGGVHTKQKISVKWKQSHIGRSSTIAREDKSMTTFKALKDRLTLLQGTSAAGDLKLKPMLIYNSERPRVLQSYTKSTLPVFYEQNNKGYQFATWLTEYVSSMLKPTAQKKRKEFFFYNITSQLQRNW